MKWHTRNGNRDKLEKPDDRIFVKSSALGQLFPPSKASKYAAITFILWKEKENIKLHNAGFIIRFKQAIQEFTRGDHTN